MLDQFFDFFNGRNKVEHMKQEKQTSGHTVVWFIFMPKIVVCLISTEIKVL